MKRREFFKAVLAAAAVAPAASGSTFSGADPQPPTPPETLAGMTLEHLRDDYVFEGLGDGNFFVDASPQHHRGPDFEVKTMWAHCETMAACLGVLALTGEAWARAWYERLRAYTLRTMPVPGHGVWRQAVDRRGRDLKRVGVSPYRKDNYHQARFLMLDLLSLERMIARG